MKTLSKIIIANLLSTIFWSSSFALSCAGFGSAYETAQSTDALVLKVELVKIDVNTSAAELKILKIYKGVTTASKIILGPDEMGFGNAATGRKVGEVWVEIFSFNSVDNEFYSFACSESSFDMTSDQKIKVQMTRNQFLEFNESQFVDYLNGTYLPKNTGLKCTLNLMEGYDYLFEIDFEILFESEWNTFVEDTVDLSSVSENYGEYKYSIFREGNTLGIELIDLQNKTMSRASFLLAPATYSFSEYLISVGDAPVDISYTTTESEQSQDGSRIEIIVPESIDLPKEKSVNLECFNIYSH